MKLYWFWSPNPQKNRLALEELGLEYELVPVDLFKQEQMQDEFIRLNPYHKVPVLEDGDFVLTESNAILSYLGEKEGRLWPLDVQGRADAARWLQFESRHLSQHAGGRWFYDIVAPNANIPVDDRVISLGEENMPEALQLLEAHMQSNQWMLGDEFTLLDCCYGPLLDGLSLSSYKLDDYPAILAFLDAIRSRPAWSKCEFKT